MKHIIITTAKWKTLLKELHNDYPTSVLAIRSKMKNVLGFTPREHKRMVVNPDYDKELYESGVGFLWAPSQYYPEYEIHLDFYDELKHTFFLLKYSEFLK